MNKRWRGIWVAFFCWAIALIILMAGITIKSGLFTSYATGNGATSTQTTITSTNPEVMAKPKPIGQQSRKKTILALTIQWSVLLMALLAIGLLLQHALMLSDRRGAFAATVTHELRTPLTTLKMYSQLLENDLVEGEERRRQYLTTIRREAERLERLVENVLTHARLNEETLKLQLDSISLEEALLPILPHLEESCKAAGMRLDLCLTQPAAQVSLKIELLAFERILFNLIENACKYSANSAERCIHLDSQVSNQHLDISVTDHGPGIPACLEKTLFKPYQHGPQPVSPRGLGLGLSISRQLAKSMGGDLVLDSAYSDGCRFILILPISINAEIKR